MKRNEESRSDLLSELSLKEKIIAEETASKYEAYKRIVELQAEIKRLREKHNDYD